MTETGIDPLVAEIEALRNRAHNWRNNSDKARVSVPLGEIRTILAGYRSQAERIAALETSHAAARENFHTMQAAANKLRIRAEAAESLLAEAREALETVRPFFDGACRDAPNAVDCLTAIDATLSRLKPGEKGGE